MAFVEGSPVSLEPGFVATSGYSVRAFHARAYSANHGIGKA